jgi:predicted transcriptional regulator
MFLNAPSPLIVPSEKYLLAILNSKLADFFIRNLGVSRSGGYFEYKPMFIQEFPAIILQGAQKSYLESMVDQITTDVADKQCVEAEIDNAIFAMYGLTAEEVAFVQKLLS